MEQNSTTREAAEAALFAGDAWLDPIEAGIRDRIRGFIGALLEQALVIHRNVIGLLITQ